MEPGAGEESDRLEPAEQLEVGKPRLVYGAEAFKLAQRVSTPGVGGVHVNEVAVSATVVERPHLQPDGIIEREDRTDIQQDRWPDSRFQ